MEPALQALLKTFVSGEVQAATPLPQVLADLGWRVAGRQAGNWEEWGHGDLQGVRERFGAVDGFRVPVLLVDPEEGADFDALYERFEGEFDRLVASAEDCLGVPCLKSEYDDPPLPVPGQFDRAAVWSMAPWSLMVSFQHEDKEVPLRLSMWIFAGTISGLP
ncbi:hypothetical protein Q0Z83_014930 [Actinoplanes sichuanensis]|uniref:Uncharacterized protein n=1 Tax=Actinoplanes sichuanensis TaxID=512349 RepID=A0ABW4A6P9_9ACTN|nr:hypothetical protein [Actinoplanes sichuanensis]BEL03302.1 hypothetical protein Q0Z83_014930 [Actinoplanes sichuanensis]